MHPGKVRTPFSLYERKFSGRPSVWYVKFWDESSRKYRKARSTGVEAVGKRRRRADAEAFLGQFFGNCQTCLLISGSDVYTEFVRGLFSLTLVLPPTVVGFYLLVLFSPFSPVGNFLETVFGWKLVFTFSGLVVASCVAGLPFMLTALRTGFVALPESLLEASWTLGKGRLSTFFLVVLPNLKSALLAGAVTTFAHTLGEFGVVLMLGGSIPGVTKVVSIALYEQVEAGNFAQAHVYAVVLLVLSYAGIFLLNSLERRSRTVRR